MTSLLVISEQMPLTIDLSSLTTMSKMSDKQFYDFCRTNPDLKIERNAHGEIIVMPPAFADS
jgi:Uma2 family endonuclease